jgi:hypothetical protein
VHGLYIYAVDPQLQQALQAAMPNNQGWLAWYVRVCECFGWN